MSGKVKKNTSLNQSKLQLMIGKNSTDEALERQVVEHIHFHQDSYLRLVHLSPMASKMEYENAEHFSKESSIRCPFAK
jgi:hypothetical protein